MRERTQERGGILTDDQNKSEGGGEVCVSARALSQGALGQDADVLDTRVWLS